MLTHFIMIYILPTSETIGLQEAQSLQMRLISSFYEEITFYLIVILTVVSYILASALYNYTSEKISDKLTELPTLEFIWTTLPAFILAAIAIPSFLLLYQVDLDLSMVFQVTDTCTPGKMDRSWSDTLRDLVSIMLEPNYGYKSKGKAETQTHITNDCISFCNDHKREIIIIGGIVGGLSIALVFGYYGIQCYQDYLHSYYMELALDAYRKKIIRQYWGWLWAYGIYPEGLSIDRHWIDPMPDLCEDHMATIIEAIKAVPRGPGRDKAILAILNLDFYQYSVLIEYTFTDFKNNRES